MCCDISRFQVAMIQFEVFCFVVAGHRRFEGPCCLHLQGKMETTSHRTTNSMYILWSHLL